MVSRTSYCGSGKTANAPLLNLCGMTILKWLAWWCTRKIVSVQNTSNIFSFYYDLCVVCRIMTIIVFAKQEAQQIVKNKSCGECGLFFRYLSVYKFCYPPEDLSKHLLFTKEKIAWFCKKDYSFYLKFVAWKLYFFNIPVVRFVLAYIQYDLNYTSKLQFYGVLL